MRPELLAALLALACQTDQVQPTVSTKARVKARTGEVWGRDLAQGLALEDWELCTELGTYDCISDAHLVTLGGVEPERLGIDEPLPSASVSAPMAVDRVAVAACGERLARDEEGTAVIFGPVLAGNSPDSRRQVATVLVQRLLGRHPTDEQLDGLVDLYDTIEPLSSDPVREWAIGACMVVATSTEALFY